jgi:hypothetical protein
MKKLMILLMGLSLCVSVPKEKPCKHAYVYKIDLEK